jgi:hypothetical protein
LPSRFDENAIGPFWPGKAPLAEAGNEQAIARATSTDLTALRIRRT